MYIVICYSQLVASKFSSTHFCNAVDCVGQYMYAADMIAHLMHFIPRRRNMCAKFQRLIKRHELVRIFGSSIMERRLLLKIFSAYTNMHMILDATLFVIILVLFEQLQPYVSVYYLTLK